MLPAAETVVFAGKGRAVLCHHAAHCSPTAVRSNGSGVSESLLLYGPPGCGNTCVAKVIADELGVYFIFIKVIHKPNVCCAGMPFKRNFAS